MNGKSHKIISNRMEVTKVIVKIVKYGVFFRQTNLY